MINIPPPVRAPRAEPAGSRPSELLQQDGRAQAGRQAGRRAAAVSPIPKRDSPSRSSVGSRPGRLATAAGRSSCATGSLDGCGANPDQVNQGRALPFPLSDLGRGSPDRAWRWVEERNEKRSWTEPILACAARRRKVLPKSKSAGLVPGRASPPRPSGSPRVASGAPGSRSSERRHG